jgi:nucleotide-binding universal stress UspA family protein
MAAPDLEIISTAVIGATVTVLVGQAEGAELLVVGNHGHGSHGVRASRRGQSVAFAVTARAFCPVVVVRAWHEGDPDEVFGAGLGGATRALGGAEGDRVVVASDGSTWAAAATRFAFEVAARRRMRLSVLRAWTPPFAGYPRMVLGLQQLERAQRQQLLADLSAEQSEFPDVDVELMLVRDKHNHHGRALIEESAIATLVVLGSHVHSKFPGLLTDATCKAVLEQARCPVAVVKPQPSTTPIPMQPHVEPRVERPAQPLGQPAGS